MTQQKDLKRRIRERMTRTGESYTAARASVLAQRPDAEVADAVSDAEGPAAAAAELPAADAYDATVDPPRSPIAVVEPRHVTEEAAALGLTCKVLATDGFDARRALRQLHDILVMTDDDDLEVLRTAVLRGERPRWKAGAPLRWDFGDVRKFLVRAKAGVGGVGPQGWMLAYVCDGVMLLATLSLMRGGAITLWLRRVEQTGADELALAGITLR